MKALLIDKAEGHYRCAPTDIEESQLPKGTKDSKGDVLVRVEYSTLNYKDSLAITGRSPVVRNFPMVPGIDFSGVVEESDHEDFSPGTAVVLNGWGVGEVHWGGLAQKARVHGDWLIPLPEAFTPKQAMIIGTAGYTAMLSVLALEKHDITPQHGEILVTGAVGGVGSFAVRLLARLGYEVVASTGRLEESDYLKSLGARRVIDRKELSEKGGPLGKQRFAGAVDCVGGQTLASICANLKYGGVVAACGLAQGIDLPATVMPFILRGVSLVGIESVYCPTKKRHLAWQRLSRDLDADHLQSIMTQELTLKTAVDVAQKQLSGLVKGRVVVNPNI